jgi:hypothetical protein
MDSVWLTMLFLDHIDDSKTAEPSDCGIDSIPLALNENRYMESHRYVISIFIWYDFSLLEKIKLVRIFYLIKFHCVFMSNSISSRSELMD